MLALLLLAAATVTGVCAAERLSLAYGAVTRLAIGAAFGQLLLPIVPFYFAYSFDLGARAAGLLATGLLTLLASVACVLGARPLSGMVRELVTALREPRHRPLLLAGAAFMALFAWLHHTHYLRPVADGLHSAGVTWGDLPLHAGLASRFLKADGLPVLEHPLFLHGPLIYPFLPDYAVAVLAALGLGLRGAFIASGVLGLAALVLAVHALTRAWLGGTRALEPILALLLFFLAGGLGFVFSAQRLLDGTPWLELLRTTNATYDISPHIAKAGHVGNLFLASRCAIFGMSIGVSALLVLAQGLQAAASRRALLLVAGAVTGALPLVHTHSFLVISGVLLGHVAFAGLRRAPARAALCLAPLVLLSLPQMWFLSDGGKVSYLRFEPGFLRPSPSALDWSLDLLLGMGIGFLLVPFALRSAPLLARRSSLPFLCLLPLANVIAFAPAAYDNIKLIAWFDLAAAVLLASWLAPALRGERRTHASRAGAGLAFAACTLSGALAVGFELTNDGLAVPAADVELAQLVEAHTPPGAVIATAASYHDPVVMLAGRRTPLASPYMARLNGIDVRARANEVVQLYAGGAAGAALIEHFDLYAVVVGPAERELPMLDEAFFAQRARARYEADGRRLYVLDRQRAR